jgi:membrane-bound lytic murein transglycosylase D
MCAVPNTRALCATWLAVLIATSPAPALASIESAVSWSDMSVMDLRPVFRSQYASTSNMYDPVVSDSVVELVLRDADEKIAKEFAVTPDMRAPVRFWLRVYTELTTHHVAIFDDRHPELVYEVLDFRELAHTARNRVAYEIMRQNRIRATFRAYRQAFAQLARNPHPRKPTAVQERILATLAKATDKHSMRERARFLRGQTGQRDNIIKGLLAAEVFFPKMERIFTEVGVPAELTRLSLVESSFNMSAQSRVGATGVWQFMLRSAQEYMTVDRAHDLDERLSPLKSSVAAAKLLKRNHSVLNGSWPLAITSYNHGFSGLKKIAARSERGDSKRGMFAGCGAGPKLGWAGRNYYSEFLAVLYAEQYRELFYGQVPSPVVKAIGFHRVDRAQTAVSLAKSAGIPLQEFRFLNPDIRNMKRAVPRGTWIALPGASDDLAGLMRRTVRRRT